MKKLYLLTFLITISTAAFSQENTKPITEEKSEIIQEQIKTEPFENIKNDILKPAPTKKINNYLVLNGYSHHFSKAPEEIKNWNESNYGIGYNRSYKKTHSPNWYAIEAGYLKDSYTKESVYFAGNFMKDVGKSSRFAIGVMAGLAYRTTEVRTVWWGYENGLMNIYKKPIVRYESKHIVPVAGLVAQMEIPNTRFVLQTTLMPKIHQTASGVAFIQLLTRL